MSRADCEHKCVSVVIRDVIEINWNMIRENCRQLSSEQTEN